MNELDIAISFSREQLTFLYECGFNLTEGYAPANYNSRTNNYVLYYDSPHKLIEFALRTNGDNIECVIRKKINGKPAPYNDKENCLSAFMLKYLQDGLDYNTIKVYGFGFEQRKDVIKTYAKLLLDNKDTLCSSIWFATHKMRENYNKEFFEKWGIEIDPSKPSIENLLTEKTSFLLDEGFSVIEDSDLLPPYQRYTWHIIYSKGDDIINIHQEDWRDAYNSFVIAVNKKDVFKANVSDYKNVYEMANHFVYILKENI